MNQLKVLIVDDNRGFAVGIEHLLETLFRHFDVSARKEESFQGALNALSQDNFDVYFLDGQIIGGFGYDLVEPIREFHSRVCPDKPFVIIGMTWDGESLKRFKLTAVDFVTGKPVSDENWERINALISVKLSL